ncbi:MAG: nuclear transport factor 2 family protein [Bacteroidota bacterium]
MVTNILKGLFISCLMCLSINVFSQYNTKVVITDVNNNDLKQKMQNNASQLLSELNSAFFDKRKPKLNESYLTNEAIKSILLLWETSMFRCYETDIIEKALYRQHGGLEIRNIPLFFKEADTTDQYQEAVMIFTSNGLIDNIYISIETNRYNKLLNQGKTVTEFRRRQIILDFIENFRTSYNRKDIDFLNKVYSDDALIITGKVIKVSNKNNDMMQKSLTKEQVIYQKQSKTEYISSLKRIFKNNSYINIKFDSIAITQHPVYPEIYGVSLMQGWNTTNYSDNGYLFLMIDFQDENNPLIQIRTWQPFNILAISKTDSVFNLGDFNIVK